MTSVDAAMEQLSVHSYQMLYPDKPLQTLSTVTYSLTFRQEQRIEAKDFLHLKNYGSNKFDRKRSFLRPC